LPDHFQKMLAPDFYESRESREGQEAFLRKRPPDFSKYRR
jgi:1,4-dihydroxy-2-naphthoyl-CoA synthase